MQKNAKSSHDEFIADNKQKKFLDREYRELLTVEHPKAGAENNLK